MLPSAYRQLGKQPRLIHVFLEEADEFAPQRMPRGETKMFSAVEQTVRRGRARGLGITMITQRSAVLNKNVLEQTDVLIAMRTTGPNDRKAVAGWIAAKADESEGPGVVESLPTLETGEAWIWNPERDMLQLVKIRARKTLDVSGRLAPGERRATVAMKPIDLSALGARIQETVERQRENDPAALKKRVRELQAELARGERAPAAVETIEVPVVEEQQIRQLEIAAGIAQATAR